LSVTASGGRAEEDENIGRVIGQLRGSQPGPTLVTVCGIHGNEKAGVHATRRVLARLARGDVALKGELTVVAGNLAAMNAGKRYILRDLNRVWTDAQVEALEAKVKAGATLDSEELEQEEILAEVRAAKARATGSLFLVDLHTTSAAGIPFVIFGDTLQQRIFVSTLPLPVILGLEEKVEGVLSCYASKHGFTTFAVEGGQHDDPGSVDNLEAVLLLALEAAGLVEMGALREADAGRELLERRRGDLPRVMEVVARYAIVPGDAFIMEPGFRNLDHAKAMQLLARDRHGEIRAPRDGLVLLPLYQAQGSDGFFWGQTRPELVPDASRPILSMGGLSS